ncbi:MAG: alginate export family protein [Bacteroidales bacterium]|nr:alginate export family protein [Bacteroidales bacterium]
MKTFKLSIACILAVVSLSTSAQVILDGEFRPRMIIDGGYKTIKLESDPVFVYISQRSRVNLSYKKNKLETYFSIQDVHVWGDDDMYSSSGVSGNSKGINLYQAWFTLKPSSHISIKTGRQQFNYDDQRLLASRNWNEYQVTYDAILLNWSKENNKLDLATSWNSSGSSSPLYPKGKIKTMSFARYEKTSGPFNLSGIALFTGYTKADTLTDIAFTGTYGINLLFQKNDINARITGYYQHNINELNGKISAYCLSLLAQKSFLEKKASLALAADFVSGNDGTNTANEYLKVQHRFSQFYGNRHGLLGYMDYFTSVPNQGLQDYMLKAEYKFSKSTLFQADYHYFRLNNNGYDPVNPSIEINKELGSELDLTLQWKIMSEVSLQAGYSMFVATETLEKLKNVYNKETKFPQFAYIMISVKPTFFKAE